MPLRIRLTIDFPEYTQDTIDEALEEFKMRILTDDYKPEDAIKVYELKGEEDDSKDGSSAGKTSPG